MERALGHLASPRFWGFWLLAALVWGVIIAVGAITEGGELAWPAAVAAVLFLGAAIGGRIIHARQPEHRGEGGRRERAAGRRDTQNFEYPLDDTRPLGDTPEAHDEITPHDIPKYNADARHAAEHETGGDEGATIRGHREGGAQGEGGPADDRPDRVEDDEKDGAQPFESPSQSGRSPS